MWKLCMIMIAVGVIIPCESTTNTSSTDALERWRCAIMSFNGILLPHLVSNRKDYQDAIAVSPAIPIYFLTQMAYKCKNGSQTCSELFTFINLKGKEEILRVLKQLKNIISEVARYNEFKYAVNLIANLHLNYKFTKDFKQIMMIPTNETKAVNVNLADPKKARRIINSLVAQETDNKVLNCIESPNIINKKQQINSISGIYLDTCFEKSNYNNITICKYYLNNNRTSSVPYMCMIGVYNYTECDELNAKILEIPLKISGFSAFVFLPNEKSGLMDLVERLKNVEHVKKAFNTMTRARVHLHLPLFDNIRKVNELRDILKEKANVDSIFDPNEAQFEGLVENDKPVSLTLCHQKIILECNRTECDTTEESPDYSECSEDLEEEEFKADHPVVIYYMYKGIVIICSIGKPLMFS